MSPPISKRGSSWIIASNVRTNTFHMAVHIIWQFFLFVSAWQMIACAIAVGVFLHAGNHLACDFPRLINSSPEDFALISSDFQDKKPTYRYLLTGTEGVTGISMVVLMAIAFTLASRYFRRNVVRLPAPFNRLTGFNAFWYSHHLFVIVYILLVVHGTCLFLAHEWNQKTVRTLDSGRSFIKKIEEDKPMRLELNALLTFQTWMYISVPLLLYVAERSVRTCRSEHYSVKILKVTDQLRT